MIKVIVAGGCGFIGSNFRRIVISEGLNVYVRNQEPELKFSIEGL